MKGITFFLAVTCLCSGMTAAQPVRARTPPSRFMRPSSEIRAFDTEAYGYRFGSYATSNDTPDPYSGSYGHLTTVAAGGTVTRDNYAVGFYKCCMSPTYEQIITWTIYGPDTSGNATLLLAQNTTHQTTNSANQPCWDGMWCGATSVDFFPWWTIDCSWKLGDYRAVVARQSRSSAYETLSPVTTVFERTWKMGPRKDALTIDVTKTQLRAGITYGKMFGSQQRPVGEKARLRVTAADCAPIPNLAVSIKREWIAQTGGHLHLVSNDQTPPVTDVVDLASPNGVTNSNGIFETDITAMNIAGHLKLTAQSTAIQPGQTVSSEPFGLHVGFFNLTDLAPLDEPDVAAYLTLTGHNSATCIGSGCDNHRDQSHFAADAMLPFLVQLAKRYNDEVQPAVFQINDISLPDGGLFDIDGNWSPSHWYHRIGCAFDLDPMAIDPSTGATVWLNITKVTEFVDDLGGHREIEGPIHYELGPDVQDAVLAGAVAPYSKTGAIR